MKLRNYFFGLFIITLLLSGCNNERDIIDQTNREKDLVVEEEITDEDINNERDYVLIIDENLDNVSEDLIKPQELKVGDVGLVLERDGEFLLVDFIRPVGDLPDDWSFARGYVPKENTILNPSEEKLRELSNVARLKDGEITLEDSLNGNEYLEQGNRYVSIIEVDDDRLLIEMPGGANDAWVSSSDVDYNLGYFEGYSDWDKLIVGKYK